MAATTLGCGLYEVYFKTRGGDLFVCRARNITALSYARVLNEVSEASITISLAGQDDECCACIGNINPWEHEIAIYRDGVEVWCGPVTNAEIDLDTLVATFSCKDLLAWADKRWVELHGNDYDVSVDDEFPTDLADVFNFLLSHGYNKEPWNMDWVLDRTNIPVTKFYPAYEDPDRWGGAYPKIGNELRELAKAGCDYTVINRRLIGGNISVNPPVILPRLFDVHWAKLPKITVIGTGMATEVGDASGNGGFYGYNDDQMWIEAQNDEFRARFGLLQEFYTEPTLDDVDTTVLPNPITQAAAGLRELKKQPYSYITGGELSQTAPVDMNSLVPGALVAVSLTQTCRSIEAIYRLTNVRVSYDASKESVSIELTPKGIDALRT